MATHIVRIYRAGKGPPPWLVGVVEEVGREELHRFKDATELWAVLAALEGVSGRKGAARERGEPAAE